VTVDGPPVLAYEENVSTVGHRHDGHGARVTDDVRV